MGRISGLCVLYHVTGLALDTGDFMAESGGVPYGLRVTQFTQVLWITLGFMIRIRGSVKIALMAGTALLR